MGHHPAQKKLKKKIQEEEEKNNYHDSLPYKTLKKVDFKFLKILKITNFNGVDLKWL